MRLIPNILLKQTPHGEKQVFRVLDKLPWGNQWSVFHSLNCSEHEYKRWAEIDFLLLGPEGIFVLEVKGGPVSVHEGVWELVGGKSREGPFLQAKSAMFAIQKDFLVRKYGFGPAKRNTMCFGFGVVFPHVEWNADSPEMPREVVADKHSLESAYKFEQYLQRLLSYWQKKSEPVTFLSTEELRFLRAKLRPEIDVYPPFSVNVGLALDEILRLTTEQYQALDRIEGNDRIFITGGAGTGKTFLAMQCARREAAKGKDVLLVVESPILATHLRSLDPDPHITVRAFQQLKQGKTFDVLLVDEGQDLLTFKALELLDKSIDGGLDEGRWRWFMDANNQARLRGNFDDLALEHLKTGLTSGKPVEYVLRENVRTTQHVAEKIQTWTRADIGTAELLGHGDPPIVTTIETLGDAGEKIEAVIKELLHEVQAEDIGIIIAEGADQTFLGYLRPKIARMLLPLDVETVAAGVKGRILWGSARDFKGLERPVILAVGFESAQFMSERRSEFYVALSRTNYGLWLFVDASLREALSEAEKQKNVS